MILVCPLSGVQRYAFAKPGFEIRPAELQMPDWKFIFDFTILLVEFGLPKLNLIAICS